MIVSPQFDGDLNKVLQDAQHDSYGVNAWLIFEACSNKIIEASGYAAGHEADRQLLANYQAGDWADLMNTSKSTRG